MGEFAFKVFLHVSFVVVVVVGFAYIGCSGCGTSRGRTAVRGCRMKRANSLTIHQRQMIQARRPSFIRLSIPSIWWLPLSVRLVPIDIDGACSFIHCVVNKGLLSSWSGKNCIVMRARKRRREGMSSSFMRQSMLPQPWGTRGEPPPWRQASSLMMKWTVSSRGRRSSILQQPLRWISANWASPIYAACVLGNRERPESA